MAFKLEVKEQLDSFTSFFNGKSAIIKEVLVDVNPNKTKNIFNREEGHGFIPTAKVVDIRRAYLMKIRKDFVTNSSSSSYIVITKSNWGDFLSLDLPVIVYEYIKEYELESLITLLEENSCKLDSREKVIANLVDFFHYRFMPKDESMPFNERYSQSYEMALQHFKEDLMAYDDSYHYFELGPFEDKRGLLEREVEGNDIFDYDAVQKKDIKIYYLNNH